MSIVEEEWTDISLAMKSTNGFPIFHILFFFDRIEKNKSITWAAASLLLSLQTFPAADLFANMHFPCVTDTPKQFIK